MVQLIYQSSLPIPILHFYIPTNNINIPDPVTQKISGKYPVADTLLSAAKFQGALFRFQIPCCLSTTKFQAALFFWSVWREAYLIIRTEELKKIKIYHWFALKCFLFTKKSWVFVNDITQEIKANNWEEELNRLNFPQGRGFSTNGENFRKLPLKNLKFLV
jgi:hypothetical protein